MISRLPLRRRPRLGGIAAVTTVITVIALTGADIGVAVGSAPLPSRVATAGAGAGAKNDCRHRAPTTASGPLADAVSIAPSGIVEPHTTPGATADVRYRMTFRTSYGAIRITGAYLAWIIGGAVCSPVGNPPAGVPHTVQVVDGSTINESARFVASDPDGTPLPRGRYTLGLAIPYADSGASHTDTWRLTGVPIVVVVA